MRGPTSEEDVQRLLKERPERTETIEVAPEVLQRIARDEKAELRELDESEVEELAAYLEVKSAELAGPFRVVDASCESCGRRLSFLDFVRTGVDEGPHGREQLRDVLTGRAGAWLTIRGRDGGRPVTCISCGNPARVSEYSEYSSSSYAYA